MGKTCSKAEVATEKERVSATWTCRNTNGQVFCPAATTVDENGLVYTIDYSRHKMVCYTINGVLVRECGWGTTVAYQLPIGIAIQCRGLACPHLMTVLSAVPPVARWPPGLASLCAAYVGQECLQTVGGVEGGRYVVQVSDALGTVLNQVELEDKSVKIGGEAECAIHKNGRVSIIDFHSQCVHWWESETGKYIGNWQPKLFPYAHFPIDVAMGESGVITSIIDSGPVSMQNSLVVSRSTDHVTVWPVPALMNPFRVVTDRRGVYVLCSRDEDERCIWVLHLDPSHGFILRQWKIECSEDLQSIHLCKLAKSSTHSNLFVLSGHYMTHIF